MDPSCESIRAVYHSDPGIAEAVMSYRFDFGVGATGQAVFRGQSVIANHGDSVQVRVHIPGEPDHGGEHVMAVPVVVEDQVKVALTLRREAVQEPFTPDEARRAALFARHAASAFLLQELAEHRRQLAEKVDELEETNHHKDAFVAGVSHELRTPLTAIIGNVMTVAGLGDMLGADERRELLVAAERQAKRLGELLENLLAESRLSGNDPLVSNVSVDVRSFVEEVADTLRFRAPGRVVLAHVEGRPEVVTDRTLLYRVLFNLGDNALKYSDGAVTITAREADKAGIRFDVEDRGIGIEPDKVPLVFEQFSQVDPSDHRKVGGVGLGLHLARKATEALGGEIHVDSKPGAGSTFSVWLRESPPSTANRRPERRCEPAGNTLVPFHPRLLRVQLVACEEVPALAFVPSCGSGASPSCSHWPFPWSLRSGPATSSRRSTSACTSRTSTCARGRRSARRCGSSICTRTPVPCSTSRARSSMRTSSPVRSC